MIKNAVFVALAFLFLTGTGAFGQGPCAHANGKLACVIPQEYGADTPFAFSQAGLFANQGHEGHFDTSILDAFRPLTADIGRQANLLPLASPSSGFVLTYDSSLKTFVTSNTSLGPILGERAETVGRHRLFIGFSYQFFNFDKIDSVDLHNIPVVLTHAEDTVDNPGKDCAINKGNLNGCSFVRDIVSTTNSIDLKVNQYTTYMTFGLTQNIDVSAVIPIENVRMNVTSNDNIILGSGLFTDHIWNGCSNPANPAAIPSACTTYSQIPVLPAAASLTNSAEE